MAKMMQFHEEALRSILKGVKALSKAVVVTLGPKGRNVVINKGLDSPLSTKDGVTVAKEIHLKDKYENMGAELVKEAASKTADVAGDGTTTAIVLADAIYSEGVKMVIAGANPMDLKKGIDKAVLRVTEALDEMATKISKAEEVKQIATISANNDPEIGAIIAEAMERVGKDGVISIAEAKGIDTTLKVVEGMQFDKGYVSPYFVTSGEKMVVEMDNPSIFITDQKIASVKQIVEILEKVMEKGPRPLLFIAEDFDAEVLATLVVNKVKAGLPVCAVKAPGFGDQKKAMLEDMAVLTGATVICAEVGHTLEDFDLHLLGRAKKVKVGKDETTLIDGTGNPKKIQERASLLRKEIEKTTSSYEKERLESRLAKMVGGVAVIQVGAVTESEVKEKKARVEDALHATRAAVAEGIVPGGGVALLRAIKALENFELPREQMLGVEIVRKAAYMPAIALATNCGKQGNLIAEKIFERQGAWGYNGLTDEFADLIKDGVIDPVLVTKSALKNGASVSGLLLTIVAMITDKPEPKSKHLPSPMGGMGGMGGMGDMMM